MEEIVLVLDVEIDCEKHISFVLTTRDKWNKVSQILLE